MPTLGTTTTQRVVLFTEDDPLRLAGGRTLGPVEVAFETYGELSPERDNVVFVCHALTGDAHAAGVIARSTCWCVPRKVTAPASRASAG